MEPRILVGPNEVSGIPFENAGKLLYDRLRNCKATSIAIVDLNHDTDITYGELLTKSLALAQHLKTKIRKGDVIAVAIETSLNFFLASLAGLFLAVPVHLINPYFTKYELNRMLKISRPALILASDLSTTKLPTCGNCEVINLVNFEPPKASGSFEFDSDLNVNEHVAFIMNSAGTTGLPKGAIFTHEAVRMRIAESEHCPPLAVDRNEVTLINMPVFHLFGLSVSLRGLCQNGGIVIMNRIKLDKIFRSVQTYRIKTLYVNAILIAMVLDYDLAPYDLSSLRKIYVAGSIVDDETLCRIARKLNVRQAICGYGMSECDTIAVTGDNDDKTMYRPWYEQQIKIVDLKTGAKLSQLEEGEIYVKSPTVRGYFNDELATKSAFDSEGFFATGDLGYYTDDGCIRVTDRLKNIFWYKKYQISPGELEKVLLKLKGIRDAVVIGKPDGVLGCVPMAFVVKNDDDLDEKQIIDHVAAYVCNYKQLRGGVKFIEAIPRNCLGKIQRQLLIEMI